MIDPAVARAFELSIPADIGDLIIRTSPVFVAGGLRGVVFWAANGYASVGVDATCDAQVPGRKADEDDDAWWDVDPYWLDRPLAVFRLDITHPTGLAHAHAWLLRRSREQEGFDITVGQLINAGVEIRRGLRLDELSEEETHAAIIHLAKVRK